MNTRYEEIDPVDNRRYFRKNLLVNAIRFTGKNHKEIRAFFKDKFYGSIVRIQRWDVFAHGPCIHLMFGKDDRFFYDVDDPEYVEIGCWIVVQDDGEVYSLDDDCFRERFKAKNVTETKK